MLAELNAKFFEHVADGDEELKALIQERGNVDEDPGQDGGAVVQAQAEGLMAQAEEVKQDVEEAKE